MRFKGKASRALAKSKLKPGCPGGGVMKRLLLCDTNIPEAAVL